MPSLWQGWTDAASMRNKKKNADPLLFKNPKNSFGSKWEIQRPKNVENTGTNGRNVLSLPQDQGPIKKQFFSSLCREKITFN